MTIASAASAGPFCLGCMHFGTRVPEDAAFAILDHFRDRGGRLLDTANNYAPPQRGESERLLGLWLASRRCRDEMLIATKVGANPTVPGGGFETAEGLSPAAIEHAIDASLTRLATDHIDLYYAHIDDRSVELHETLTAFTALIGAGKVSEIAASNHHAWRLALALDISRRHTLASYTAIQQRYSYLQPLPSADLGVQVAVNDELLDLCNVTDTTLLAYSPLLSGAYTRDDIPLDRHYHTADNIARLDTLRRIATSAGATPNQVALAWLRQSQAAHVIPVISASSVDQLNENMDTTNIRLSHEQLDTLTNAPLREP